MTLSPSVREQVRRRAQYACEFCGVSEISVGSLLTIDHFHPRSKGGSDDLENFIYACNACNQHKQDYWPKTETDPKLWNPREESAIQHFIEQEDGQITALTSTGEFTIKRLRLNRSQLVTARQNQNKQQRSDRMLQQYQELTALLTQTNRQITNIAQSQNILLEEQRKLLKILLRRLN
jgi:HNH endonuclease